MTSTNFRMVARLHVEVNPNKTGTVRELGPVDVEALREAVLALPEDHWDRPEDFHANYNKKGALRSATHVTFRFSDRRDDPIRYLELPAWDEFRSLLEPVLADAVRAYGYEACFFPRVMLARLPEGAFIPPHVDGDGRGSIPHKVHVPLRTNPKSYFFVEEERFHLREGMAYEVNNGARHSVVNGGPGDRIHLLFEVLDASLQEFLS